MMRGGMSPKRACEEAVKRIVKKIPQYENHQIGYLALSKSGEYGSFCIQPGFNYAVKTESFTGLEEAEAW
jgi:isoaspartyl peptidase/L-asparaginase-like protein (Ntn-hydrolase superfamily)